jgi:hypothetical protein
LGRGAIRYSRGYFLIGRFIAGQMKPPIEPFFVATDLLKKAEERIER